MSSMTDMVFLLLIFVLIMSQFKQNSALDILVPNTPDDHTPKKESVSVGIEMEENTKNLIYYINSKENIVDFSVLGANIKNELDGKPQPNVMIYVDQQVPTQNTMEVIAVINKLGHSASVKTNTVN